MNSKESIQFELQMAAPGLVGISRQMPNAVPEGYFDDLSAIMLSKVAGEKNIQHGVPAGYFDKLPQIMLEKIRQKVWQEELEDAAPLLVGAPRQMPYTVPLGYFDELTTRVLDTAKGEAITPVIAIHRTSTPQWMRYAAVVLLLMAAFGIYRLVIGPTLDPSSPEVVQTSSNTGSATGMDTISENLLSQLSELEEVNLDASLSEIGVPAEARSPLYYLNTTNFEAALQDFSTDELSTHLQGQTTTKTNI